MLPSVRPGRLVAGILFGGVLSITLLGASPPEVSDLASGALRSALALPLTDDSGASFSCPVPGSPGSPASGLRLEVVAVRLACATGVDTAGSGLDLFRIEIVPFSGGLSITVESDSCRVDLAARREPSPEDLAGRPAAGTIRATGRAAFECRCAILEVGDCLRLMPEPAAFAFSLEPLEVAADGDSGLAAWVTGASGPPALPACLADSLAGWVERSFLRVMEDVGNAVCAGTPTGRGVWAPRRERGGRE